MSFLILYNSSQATLAKAVARQIRKLLIEIDESSNRFRTKAINKKELKNKTEIIMIGIARLFLYRIVVVKPFVKERLAKVRNTLLIIKVVKTIVLVSARS